MLEHGDAADIEVQRDGAVAEPVEVFEKLRDLEFRKRVLEVDAPEPGELHRQTGDHDVVPAPGRVVIQGEDRLDHLVHSKTAPPQTNLQGRPGVEELQLARLRQGEIDLQDLIADAERVRCRRLEPVEQGILGDREADVGTSGRRDGGRCDGGSPRADRQHPAHQNGRDAVRSKPAMIPHSRQTSQRV